MKWLSVRLESLISMYGGGTPSKQNPAFWNGDIPWVSPKDMGSREIQDSQDHITEEAVEKSTTQIVPAGSVLVVVRSGILVRKIPIGIAQRPMAINQDMKALVPNQSLLDSSFLAYLLESKQQALLTGYVKRGATVHSLQVDKLKKMVVQLPPMSEQRRIVEILDQANVLRNKRTEADAKASRILSALFYRIFGDPATNPMGWETGTLNDVILETQYGTSTRAESSATDATAVIRMNNISIDGQLELNDLKYAHLATSEREKLRLSPDDLLFNRTNSRDLVGKTGIWQCELECAVPASYLIRVRLNTEKVSPKFVWAYMNTRYVKSLLFEKARHAIGMANINATELRSIRGFFPDRNNQEQFSRQLAALTETRDKLKRVGQRTEGMFNSIMHRAFTGDLTAKWREAHMKEILSEMEQQAKALNM